jgi:type VI secretion system protein ImpL
MAGDFFLQQRRRLQRQLIQQCHTLADVRMLEAYTKIADSFNRTLAGKFPFTAHDSTEYDAEAEPSAIRDFYRVFDTYSKTVKELLRQPGESAAASTEQILTFLERLDTVRHLFDEFLQSTGTQERPTLAFAVDFRVNQQHERGGNRIIDWQLSLGKQHFRYLDADRRGRWRYGDPIRFSVRWAKDAPTHPAADVPQPGVEVKGGRVIYTYTNPWSLFSLVRRHASAAEDFDRFVDPKPHTLKFLIDTAPVEPVEHGGSGRTALPPTKVFIRLSVTSPDHKHQRIIPSFPTVAPHLQPGQNQTLSSVLDR